MSIRKVEIASSSTETIQWAKTGFVNLGAQPGKHGSFYFGDDRADTIVAIINWLNNSEHFWLWHGFYIVKSCITVSIKPERALSGTTFHVTYDRNFDPTVGMRLQSRMEERKKFSEWAAKPLPKFPG